MILDSSKNILHFFREETSLFWHFFSSSFQRKVFEKVDNSLLKDDNSLKKVDNSLIKVVNSLIKVVKIISH